MDEDVRVLVLIVHDDMNERSELRSSTYGLVDDYAMSFAHS